MSHLQSTLSLEVVLIAARAAALLLALLLFAWGFIRWRRAAERDTQRVFEQLDLVRSDLLIMKEALTNAAQRVDVAAQRVAHDARLAPAPAGNIGRGYEIAARLARNGAKKDELIKNCGITMHEAELLVKLHGRAQGVSTAKPIEQRAADSGREVRRSPAAPASERPPPARSPQVRSRLVAVG